MSILEEAPVLDLDDAQRIVADLWGLPDPRARDLGSHQDRNFLITSADARFVLKVANTAIPDASLDAQNAAMLALVGPADPGAPSRRLGPRQPCARWSTWPGPRTACGC